MPSMAGSLGWEWFPEATTTASNVSSVTTPSRVLLTTHLGDGEQPSLGAGPMEMRRTLVLNLTASISPNASQKSLMYLRNSRWPGYRRASPSPPTLAWNGKSEKPMASLGLMRRREA